MSTVRTLVIKPTGHTAIYEVVPTLKIMQSLVDGDLEHLTLNDELHTYNSETGKLDHLPPNPLATRYLDHYLPGFALTDVLHGNLVVLGSTADGGEAPVPETAVETARQLHRRYPLAATATSDQLVWVEGTHTPADDRRTTITGIGHPGGVRETKDRVYAAIRNSGLRAPSGHIALHLTAPGLLRFPSSGDLAVATAALAAHGAIDADALTGTMLLGELALDGTLRPTPGIDPGLRTARRHGFTTAIVPAMREDITPAGGLRVRHARNLTDAITWLRHPAT